MSEKINNEIPNKDLVKCRYQYYDIEKRHWCCKHTDGYIFNNNSGMTEPCMGIYDSRCMVKEPLIGAFFNDPRPIIEEMKNNSIIVNLCNTCKWENTDGTESPCKNCNKNGGVYNAWIKKEEKISESYKLCPYQGAKYDGKYKCEHPNAIGYELDSICVSSSIMDCIKSHDCLKSNAKYCEHEHWNGNRWECDISKHTSTLRCDPKIYCDYIKEKPGLIDPTNIKQYGFKCSHNYKQNDMWYCDIPEGYVNKIHKCSSVGIEIVCDLNCDHCNVYKKEHEKPKKEVKQIKRCQFCIETDEMVQCSLDNKKCEKTNSACLSGCECEQTQLKEKVEKQKEVKEMSIKKSCENCGNADGDKCKYEGICYTGDELDGWINKEKEVKEDIKVNCNQKTVKYYCFECVNFKNKLNIEPCRSCNRGIFLEEKGHWIKKEEVKEDMTATYGNEYSKISFRKEDHYGQNADTVKAVKEENEDIKIKYICEKCGYAEVYDHKRIHTYCGECGSKIEIKKKFELLKPTLFDIPKVEYDAEIDIEPYRYIKKEIIRKNCSSCKYCWDFDNTVCEKYDYITINGPATHRCNDWTSGKYFKRYITCSNCNYTVKKQRKCPICHESLKEPHKSLTEDQKAIIWGSVLMIILTGLISFCSILGY